MAVYRVRFKMGGPIYIKADKAAQPIMLDAILGFIWCQEHGYRKVSSEDIIANQVFPELPIARKGKCYMCSAMVLPEDSKVNIQYDAMSKRDQYRKRASLTLPSFNASKDAVIKGAVLKYWALATPYVDFYADVTNEKEFRRLLGQIQSIGPKKAAGFGRILGVTMTKVDGIKAYKDKEGYPTRPVPVTTPDVEFAEDTAVGYSTYYAPYWCLRNQELCYLPNAKQYNRLPVFDIEDIIDEALGRTSEVKIEDPDVEDEAEEA